MVGRRNAAIHASDFSHVFALATVGLATLWMAIAADIGASLLVIGNGLRLLRAALRRLPAATGFDDCPLARRNSTST
jgi:hypothetical protein